MWWFFSQVCSRIWPATAVSWYSAYLQFICHHYFKDYLGFRKSRRDLTISEQSISFLNQLCETTLQIASSIRAAEIYFISKLSNQRSDKQKRKTGSGHHFWEFFTLTFTYVLSEHISSECLEWGCHQIRTALVEEAIVLRGCSISEVLLTSQDCLDSSLPPRFPTLRSWNSKFREYPCTLTAAQLMETWWPHRSRTTVIVHRCETRTMSLFSNGRIHNIRFQGEVRVCLYRQSL